MLAALLACARLPPETEGTEPVPLDTGARRPSRPSGVGGPLVVAGFNVESGGSDVAVVADEVVAGLPDVQIWGFSEVADDAAAVVLAEGAGDLSLVVGTTGWEDLLAIAWDSAVLELRETDELHAINVSGTVRAPLVGRFVHLATGIELLFMVNHLFRTDDAARHEQAELLHTWLTEQTLPVILVGDYNFDWYVPTDGAPHDYGYDALTAGGVAEWIKIDPLETTQCSTYYDSVLDFTFAAGAARDWPAESAVPPLPADYCTAEESHRSDHKPVRAVFTLP